MVFNKKMVITKDVFSETFHLPTEAIVKTFHLPIEGIVGFSGLSAKAVADMKMLISTTDVPFKPSSKKRDMNVRDDGGDQRQDEDKLGAHSVQALAAMVSTPDKQSQGYAVPLSILLEKLVKVDLGESVALHPLKVLNTKSVHTYLKKNQALVPVEVSSAAPAKSRSEISSDTDKHPLLTLSTSRPGGVAAKRKLILAPTDSESTMPLSMPEIRKKLRTKRHKTVKPTDVTKLNQLLHQFLLFQLRPKECVLLFQKTEKVSEFLQRRELIWSNMVERHLRKVVAEHWKEFNKDKPSMNQDLMSIRMLEAELTKARRSVGLFQAKVGLPITFPEKSTDRATSYITPGISGEDCKAQLAPHLLDIS
ncbi:hypothetical protein F511_41471 [Dorcoceras hygrometricum]|uniref:Uncharacterized protein n=1 Tax=Dorcoceras hygrometricum TaxID=472368 RepID=A0A2Z7BBF9_9LAMI|nr:hypothetical protein F511_41471 [Dorcoceras hygrometricum]